MVRTGRPDRADSSSIRIPPVALGGVVGIVVTVSTVTEKTVTVNTVTVDATDLAGALIETLRAETGHDRLELDGVPQHLSGGFHAELLRFRLLDPPAHLRGDLVARILPEPHHAAWEAAVQREVAAQGFPTPAVRLTAPASSALGRFLIVMDFVPGRPPMSGLGLAGILARVPRLMRDLPDQLALMAARLHRLDPRPLAEELLRLHPDRPSSVEEFVAHQVGVAEAIDRQDLARAGERLLSGRPSAGPEVIAHGDLHPFNLLVVDGGEPMLLDWTVAAIAPSGFTLGFTELMLANPPVVVPPAMAAPLRALGRRTAARFGRTYRRLSSIRGERLDDATLEWFRQVHALRILVESGAQDAGGGRPQGHPWLLLEPVARGLLGLP
jgi:aminoglycoside phosphotransferase (APT) family kinase protein